MGSILFAGIVAKLFRKDIISDSPDKNLGTANAYRYGGFLCGAFTLLCELAKGFLPVYLYIHSEGYSSFFLPLVMVAPVIGHILPVFAHFKGGKAIAVTFGSLMGFFPNWRVALTLGFFFLFFTLVVRVTPHHYRTILAYILTTLNTILFVDMTVGIGMTFISAAVSMKMLTVPEEREKTAVTMFWKNK
jgi:glycerol-3-phosphate acyltransferase PlsY